MLWFSSFVPWRGGIWDRVIKVSALGNPLADIRNIRVPPWWSILPPSPKVLRGMFWHGYKDAAQWFCKESLAQYNLFEQSAENDSLSVNREKWLAARSLLRRPLLPQGSELPKVDPATGDEILDLLAEFYKEVHRVN